MEFLKVQVGRVFDEHVKVIFLPRSVRFNHTEVGMIFVWSM